MQFANQCPDPSANGNTAAVEHIPQDMVEKLTSLRKDSYCQTCRYLLAGLP